MATILNILSLYPCKEKIFSLYLQRQTELFTKYVHKMTTIHHPKDICSRMTAALFALLILSLSATSCSKSESDDVKSTEPAKKEDPSKPIDEGNSAVVLKDGSLVSRGDISIDFPRDTYTKDVMANVVENQKGEVLGTDEVSTFYQVTIPAQVGKQLTVSLKSDYLGDDVFMVVRMPVLHLSEDELGYDNLILEATYADGAYTAKLPVSGNVGYQEETNIQFSVGLAHMAYYGKSGASSTRAESGIFNDVFTEGNVSWHFEMTRAIKSNYGETLTLHFEEINEIIREAIKKLHELGLAITKRNIKLSFEKFNNKELYGMFCQSFWCDEWSTVSFNTNILDNFIGKRTDYRASAIHELMHVYQSDYDNRMPIRKGYYPKYQLTYESGAVWAEQLMTGKFSESFVSSYVKEFIQGIDNATDIWEGADASTAFSNHGYGMAVLMEYLLRHMGEYGLNDKSIADLYKRWYETGDYAKELIQWLTKSKGWGLFTLNHYDEFLMELAKGNVVSNYHFPTLYEMSDGKINASTTSLKKEGNCYPYGTQLSCFLVNIPDDIDLNKKQLVFKNTREGTRTYVVTPAEGNLYMLEALVTPEKPFVMKGKYLKENYHKASRNETNLRIYTMTTTEDNRSTVPYQVEVVLEDAEDTPEEGGGEGEGGKEGSGKKFVVTQAIVSCNVDCDVVESDGKGNKSIYHFVSINDWYDYYSSSVITTTTDDTGTHVTCYYKSTDSDTGEETETSLTFDVSGLQNAPDGKMSVSNIVAWNKKKDSSKEEKHELSYAKTLSQTGIQQTNSYNYSVGFESTSKDVYDAGIDFSYKYYNGVSQSFNSIIDNPENNFSIAIVITEMDE